MSRKEFTRSAVLTRVADGSMTLKESVPLLGVSYRQAKRLYARYRSRGAEGLVHGNVGRCSNRARGAGERERVLELVRTEYGGGAERGPGQRFGPTLANEHLRADHGVVISDSTLRGWMLEAGLWSRVRKGSAKPRRRERREHFGELVQLDGSFHDWFEGRGMREGRRSCVMNMVDDATSTTLLRFGEQETIWAAAGVLQAWIARHGVPRALYTDWKNVYKREPTSREELLGEEGQTQFGRMCAKLGITIIAANTPQAKGRVERSNGILQDRLIKKMRLLGIADDTTANAYVDEAFLPYHNARFTVLPARTADYHLPRDPQQRDADVFCLEHRRTVSNDFVVQFGKRALQLDRAARGRTPAGAKVLVRETRDGALRVIHINGRGVERECTWTPAAPRAKSRPAATAAAAPAPRRRYKPAPGHPWRRIATLSSDNRDRPPASPVGAP
jgi:hypothetical protein